ncbi:Replication factor A protein 2 [Coemansia sp. RSA 1722]|nr:Replication factor A protein 2 [Coemansia sp. RSA 486]KAJ2602793.1 Replication factor A protein 2 [Coemansia sp. RSA 1721]KAJ2606745.1 Replication factor A protein 2 [Coemansia sp. RSA 1722]KAJ2639869.1 Replication factor A protein 2 [Coemansia sp. RSA 1286]
MSYGGGYNQYNNSGAGDYSYGGSSGGGGQDFSYGQNNNAGGGGWMNQGGMSFGGGGGDDDNKTRGGYKNQTLRPVTIKQLTDIAAAKDDAPITIDGEEIKQVTFVGVVRNINRQQINLMYSVEDGTGKIDVRVWSKDGEDDNMDGGNSGNPDIVEGGYVRVYGELKFFGGKRHVSAHKIRPVTDHNEIAYHGMEAMYVHMTKTRGVAPALQAAGASAANAAAGGGGANAYTGAGSGGYGNMGGGGMGYDNAQTAVLESLKKLAKPDTGALISDISSSLAGRFQGHEVKKAIDWLVSEGHLYNTIDDNHVSSTGQF